MTIRGVGVDIAQISRVRRLERFPKRAVRWILHPHEVRRYKKARRKTECLARFFSAKEAVFKSLGLVQFGAAGFRLIEINFLTDHSASAILYGHLRKSVQKNVKHIYIASHRIRGHILSQAISIQ